MIRSWSLLLLSLCLITAGCGVKPGEVLPSEGAQDSKFPRTYPDLSTDPRPES